MVRCPKCNRTYENDSQKFCTRDGGRLVVVETGSANFNPNATMVSGATPSFDPNATMVSPQQNPNMSQPSFDPNATVISPPSPSPQPAQPSQPTPSSGSYSEQQNFPTVAGVQIPQSQPLENPYSSQPNIPSTPYSSTADISSSQQQQPRASGQLSQPVQVPMPARYDASAPTSSDLAMPSNVSAPTSGDLGQTTIPPPPVPTDFGYTTGRSDSSPAPTDFGYTTGRSSVPTPPENMNYPQTDSAKTSADLRFPEAAADMQTQALVSPPSQSFRTSNTGESATRITAPPVANPMPAPPQAPAIGAQPKKKSSGKKMVLIGLGAVFFALLIVVVGVGVFIVTQRPEWVGMGNKANNNENVSVNNNENTTPNTNQSNESNTNANNTNTNNGNTNENTNTAPVEPPPNSTQFVNSSSGLSGDLASRFVPFSFYYPQTWKKFPNAELFVQVNRQASSGLQETFAVGNYDSKGTFEADKADFASLIQPHETRLAKDIPGYQKTGEGETTINGISGYEVKFTGASQNSDVKFFGRLVLLPPGKEGEKNGVKLLIVATSLTPEIQSVNDVGVKGELPVILSTFKLGQ